MALTRRGFLSTAPLVFGMTIGCVSNVKQPSVFHGLREVARTKNKSASAPKILVLMPETSQTREVWKGLCDELADGFQVIAVRIEHSNESAAVREAIKAYRPVALVLMNNPTLAAYKEYQTTNPGAVFPPSVVVMTSFLEGQVGALKNSTGVSYEVPLITAMTNLRRLLTLKSERVGVVVREPLKKFVTKEILLARREQVQVVTEFVGAKPNASDIKRALRRLKGQTDAIWILNDDRLLSPQLISDAWLPGLEERPWAPTIVGAGSLVLAERALGTFAVLPDHVALGAQAAAILLDMADNGWTLESGASVQLPLSTTTTMHLGQVNERFAMKSGALQQVDKVIE